MRSKLDSLTRQQKDSSQILISILLCWLFLFFFFVCVCCDLHKHSCKKRVRSSVLAIAIRLVAITSRLEAIASGRSINIRLEAIVRTS